MVCGGVRGGGDVGVRRGVGVVGMGGGDMGEGRGWGVVGEVEKRKEAERVIGDKC